MSVTCGWKGGRGGMECGRKKGLGEVTQGYPRGRFGDFDGSNRVSSDVEAGFIHCDRGHGDTAREDKYY